MLYTCIINECRCAISNLLSNDVVLRNLLYGDVALKLPKQLAEWTVISF